MDWEDCYLNEHTPWDKGGAAPPLIEWINNNPDQFAGDILVPGSGKGHDGAALSNLTHAEQITGIDISPKAVELANSETRTERFHTELGDLFDLPVKYQAAFDWVWEHTCFCAIEPEMRDLYVESVHRALKPSGQLLGVFYRDPYDEEHRPGQGPPHGTTVEELLKRFEESGKFEIVENYVPKASYDGRMGLEQVMRMKRL
ncbi:MAG: methyltransferase domain-containing protein [Verrucomicrobiota bacterium]